MSLFFFAFSCVFVQNIVLVQFLGICPFLGVSKRVETAMGMGVAVVAVITLSSVLTWLVYKFILVPFGLEYLQTLFFILIIASIVQIIEIILKKNVPFLYSSLGIYLPLITTNCAVLGVSLLSIKENYDFLQTLGFAFFTSLGFLLSILLLAGVRERFLNVPKAFRGIPIGLISAGLIALAFYSFNGISF